jgi:hypothetical protein
MGNAKGELLERSSPLDSLQELSNGDIFEESISLFEKS